MKKIILDSNTQMTKELEKSIIDFLMSTDSYFKRSVSGDMADRMKQNIDDDHALMLDIVVDYDRLRNAEKHINMLNGDITKQSQEITKLKKDLETSETELKKAEQRIDELSGHYNDTVMQFNQFKQAIQDIFCVPFGKILSADCLLSLVKEVIK